MSEFGELGESDVAMYRALLAAPGSTLAQVAERLQIAPDEIDKSIARLVDMGLVRHGENDSMSAISPMLAEATVLGAEDLELGARRAGLEQRRDAIRRLVPEWNIALSTEVV